MLNKDQALAAMDAHIIRAEAGRKQRMERRTRWLVRLYPALRSAPLEDREPLVIGASRHSLRRWPIFALATLVLGSIVAAFFIPEHTVSSTLVFRIGAVIVILELILVGVFYLGMRRFIHRAVAGEQGAPDGHRSR